MSYYTGAFTEDEQAPPAEEPTYEFAGFEIVASEKVALIPVGGQKG
jgi:hypothetical protein